MVNKKMRCCLGLAFGLAAGAQAHETRVGALSPSQHADTEATTNVVFCAGDSDDRLFRLSLELNATADNNVSVVFGTDAKKVSSDHLVGGGNPVDSHVFEDLLHDWGSSDGRGFNEVTDTHSDIIRTGYAVDATYTTSCAPPPMMEDLGLGSVAIARPASL